MPVKLQLRRAADSSLSSCKITYKGVTTSVNSSRKGCCGNWMISSYLQSHSCGLCCTFLHFNALEGNCKSSVVVCRCVYWGLYKVSPAAWFMIKLCCIGSLNSAYLMLLPKSSCLFLVCIRLAGTLVRPLILPVASLSQSQSLIE